MTWSPEKAWSLEALALAVSVLGFVWWVAPCMPRNVFERREPRVQIFWRTGWMQFPVWAPQSSPGWRWPRYQSRIWLAPFIFLLWLVRGLRLRAGWAPRGRAVTVDDMLAYHPGRPWRCLCRGEGTIASYRKGERGLSFCASMLGAFRAKAGFRVVQTKRGPRWVKGFEPERLVQVTKEAKRG